MNVGDIGFSNQSIRLQAQALQRKRNEAQLRASQLASKQGALTEAEQAEYDRLIAFSSGVPGSSASSNTKDIFAGQRSLLDATNAFTERQMALANKYRTVEGATQGQIDEQMNRRILTDGSVKATLQNNSARLAEEAKVKDARRAFDELPIGWEGDSVMAAKKKTAKPAVDSADQYMVDRVRSGMSFDNQREFDRYLKLNPTTTEIREWLRERTGTDIATAHIATWHDALSPVGSEAITLNATFDDYHGLEIHKAAQSTLGFSLKFLGRIQEHFIDNEDRFTALTAAQAIGMVPGMIREIRSLIDQIERHAMAADAMQQELGGAAFTLNELLITHKDTPLEEPIKALAPEIFRKIRAKYTGG